MQPFVHEVLSRTGRPWDVVCVCDADGGGGTLAYTVGLHMLDLPELLLRNGSGSRDGGADRAAGGTSWWLAHRDLASTLDAVGELLLAGRVVPGAWLTFGPDTRPGPVEVAVGPFRVMAETGAPDLSGLGRFGLPADRIVLTVHRLVGRAAPDPLGPPPEATDPAAAAQAVEDRTALLRLEILARGGSAARIPRRWRRPGPGRRELGPRRQVVVARAVQVLTSDAVVLRALTGSAVDLGDGAADLLVAVLPTVAVAAVRPGAPGGVVAAASDVAGVLLGERTASLRWRRAWSAARPPTPRAAWRALEPPARQRVRHHLHALLAAEAFADVLPPDLIHDARASWLLALQSTKT